MRCGASQRSAPFRGFDPGHVIPALDSTPDAYRYFALTVSVGRVVPVTERHVIELQQWQPIIEAPPASALPPTGTATLYGQVALAPTLGETLLDVVTTKDLPSGTDLYGYLEVWAAFRTRTYYHLAREWTTALFPPDNSVQMNNPRRALVSLPEILVPRRALVRTRNCSITTVPYRLLFKEDPIHRNL